MKKQPTPTPVDQGASPAAIARADRERKRSKYERFPVICIILYIMAGISLILYGIMHISTPFADWFNGTVSAFLRGVFAALTAWIPFSLGEALILLMPLILVLVMIHAIRKRCDSWRAAMVYVGILFSVIATLFTVFVWNFAAGYRSRPLEDKLELERKQVSAEELYDTTVWLVENINRETELIGYCADDFSAMPYNLYTMNRHLTDAYETFSDDHRFMTYSVGTPKPVLFSEVMSHMHITGVYSFFTGEANINVGFPDYTIPYTAAHEMAHQRGIAREDEANFMAFLVCIGSDDPYIRYSGYLNVYEYVASALWSADKDLYYKATSGLDTLVKGELAAYNDFYDRYRDSVVADVSSAVNDSYLQSQGTPGTKSYGMVVDLAVAYRKSLP